MSTDKELLERAVVPFLLGGESPLSVADLVGRYSEWKGLELKFPFGEEWWNPLHDAGDAMRLAVAIGATINPYADGVFVSRNDDELVVSQPWGENKLDATCRAVVLFADWVARQMEKQ